MDLIKSLIDILKDSGIAVVFVLSAFVLAYSQATPYWPVMVGASIATFLIDRITR